MRNPCPETLDLDSETLKLMVSKLPRQRRRIRKRPAMRTAVETSFQIVGFGKDFQGAEMF